MPLPDGTNDEKEEVSPPLEWKSKDDLKDVVLHQMKISPPCAKIRMYLTYYGVPFEVNKGQKSKHYKKVPAMVVNGRQINDSYIIIKNLVPVLTGQPFDDKWENKITYELMISFEQEIMSNSQNVTLFMKQMVPGCVACCIAPMVGRRMAKKIGEKHPGLKPSVEYGKEFAAEIGTAQFLGGDKPGQADISYYGTLVPFMHAGCPKVQEHLSESGLTEWWGRMDAIMPKVF